MTYRRGKLATIVSTINPETLEYFEDGLFLMWRAGDWYPISTFGAIGWCVANNAADDPEFRNIDDPVFRSKVLAASGVAGRKGGAA